MADMQMLNLQRNGMRTQLEEIFLSIVYMRFRGKFI